MREIVKKTLVLTAATAAIAVISGCASTIPMGALYTNVKLPVSGAGDKGTKVGTATCDSICNVWAEGDASVNAAAEKGKVTNVKRVEFSTDGWLGFYRTYTTTVYGD